MIRDSALSITAHRRGQQVPVLRTACLLLQGQSFQYQVYPRIDKLACTTDEIGGGAGPTAQAQRRLLQSNAAAKLGLVSPCHPPAALSAVCEGVIATSGWFYNVLSAGCILYTQALPMQHYLSPKQRQKWVF